MSSTSYPTITNNTRFGSHDATWASVYSFINYPQFHDELVERYGKSFEVLDALKMTGREGTCAGETLTVYEKGAPERYITLHSASGTAAAGVDLTLEIEEWDTVANGGRSAVAIGDKIGIPGAYCTKSGVKQTLPMWYQVTAIASTTANPDEPDTNITATPLDKLSVVAVTVPAGTKLMVTGGNYAAGSAGAKSKTNGWYYRTFRTAIKKAALALEGSQQSTERYVDKLRNGGAGVFSQASIEAEFRLDQAINYEILLGGVVDNLAMDNQEGIANAARGTLGIMPHLAASGCKQYFTDTYTISDFDNIKKAFISQGVTDTKAEFFMGSELYRGVENSMLDFVKEYSGGSDFIQDFQNVNVGFKKIKKNSIDVTMHELVSFSNPNTLGNYGFENYGFIIPTTQVSVRDSVNGSEAKISNLRLLYKSYNGEDRTRIMKTIAGVNGLEGTTAFASHDFDNVKIQWLSEFLLEYLKVNQSLLVMPESVR